MLWNVERHFEGSVRYCWQLNLLWSMDFAVETYARAHTSIESSISDLMVFPILLETARLTKEAPLSFCHLPSLHSHWKKLMQMSSGPDLVGDFKKAQNTNRCRSSVIFPIHTYENEESLILVPRHRILAQKDTSTIVLEKKQKFELGSLTSAFNQNLWVETYHFIHIQTWITNHSHTKMPQDCRLVLFQVTSLWRHGPHPSTTTPFGVEKNGGEILTSGTSISLATTGYARKPHQTRKRAWSKLLRIWVATVNHIYCTHHLYNTPCVDTLGMHHKKKNTTSWLAK